LAVFDRFWYKLGLVAAVLRLAIGVSVPASDQRGSPGSCLRGQYLERRRWL